MFNAGKLAQALLESITGNFKIKCKYCKNTHSIAEDHQIYCDRCGSHTGVITDGGQIVINHHPPQSLTTGTKLVSKIISNYGTHWRWL